MDDSIAVSDLSSAEVQDVLDLAVRLKKEYFDRGNPPLLEGKVLSMIFQKPSLWTRVSFDGAMRQPGGDALTIQEKFGKGKGLNMAFAGDGNNLAVSLMEASAKLGWNFTVANPQDYELNPQAVEVAKETAEPTGSRPKFQRDP